jgi:hypothetical protein
VLDGLFPEWFLVMEFNPESGLPHFHGIAIADANVSRGWHHQPYEEIGKLNRRAHRERRKLTEAELVQRRAWSRHLTPNKDLRLIQDVLGEVLPDFGFGRSQPSHATPLQSWKKTHLSSPEVRGRVVDAATKKPISGAVVQILDRPYTKVQSDPAGRFRMQPHFNLHLACIPGPCSYLYIPEGRPYSDDMIVTHPRYTSCQFPAHRLSATHITSVEPERVTTSDIRLELKAR